MCILEFLTKNLSLTKRVISALVLAPLVIICIFHSMIAFMVLAVAAAAMTAYEWLNMVKGQSRAILLSVLGLLYVVISYSSFIFIRFGFEEGALLILVVILSVWSSDSFAYLLGKTLKGPKLCPKISPNKTWAGLGGSVLGFILILGASVWFLPLGLKPFPFATVLIVGALGGVMAQAGDLLVSILKRRAGVKDTGQLIPGHGGLLDRIDALMLITPLAALLLIWIQG